MDRPPPGDDALAVRALDGDSTALGELYARHAGPLLAYLLRLMRGRMEAEDVLHDTFMKLLDGGHPYRGDGRFRPWLFTVATRLGLDRLRTTRHRLELLAARPVRPPVEASPPVMTQAVQRHLELVLAGLPADYAATFHLRIAEDFTYGEIAAMRGEPEGTLRSRVHQVLRRLRERLAPAIPPVGEPSGPLRRSNP